MKELSTEEKAKRYEKALEKARQLCAYPTSKPFISDLQDLFLELKESEDERIRKELINFVKSRLVGFPQCEKYISWLEKQNDANKEYWRGYREGKQEILDKYAELEKKCEQKSVDKVEPKFKVGDWISDGNITIQIEAIKNNCYSYCGDCTLYSIKTADKVYHLWTIKEAKDGDVLVASDGSIFIYKNQRDNGVVHYVAVTSYNDLVINENDYSWESKNACYPATKDEQTILFERIKEAGYEWDATKKQLKKL